MNFELSDCSFSGPALPEPFVQFELATVLAKHGLLHEHVVQNCWSTLRRSLATLGASAGRLRVNNHVLQPLLQSLGYAPAERQPPMQTREGVEDGGWLARTPDNAQLRLWSVDSDIDLDVPHRTGRAYRFSPTRCAQRVLLAASEHVGLLTNGEQLRLLLCDAARPDSHIAIRLTAWRGQRPPPDSLRLLLAIVAPTGLAALPEILDAARLSQVRITKDLRVQARAAIEGFLQSVLDHPGNRAALPSHAQADKVVALWQESLVLVYRLLFILKLESATDTTRAFSFASTRLWRHALSPNQALGPLVRRHLDQGQDTGRMLEDGLRCLFRAFRDGLSCSELRITPLGGALFGSATTPHLDALQWGERGVALLLDRLLWTKPPNRARERVHYGSLDVEDLGRIYEALLDLEPGLAEVPMVRLRRARLDVVLPKADAAPVQARSEAGGGTRTVWMQDIAPGRFFLRAGLGRKATGAYYTPHAFVRFLVQQSLAPQIAQRSPDDDPNPNAILTLKIVDPATGSGHFLVEACRFLGEALYVACRLCDDQATAAEAAAARTEGEKRTTLQARAVTLRDRLAALPDGDGSLAAYLPSHACEGGAIGPSQQRGLAICRRLVAVHCLYGVDCNALAVELAKLSLWLESYAEGLPLTFLDHRLLVGDSLAGAFFAQLETLPISGKSLSSTVSFGIAERLHAVVVRARREVRVLDASVGRDTADLIVKQAAKTRLDALLAPLRNLARAWSGAVLSGAANADAAWFALARQVARTGVWPNALTDVQATLLRTGSTALPWDLTFPEVFAPDRAGSSGFNAVLGNPPWDVLQYSTRDFVAAFDPTVLDAPTKQERSAVEHRVLADPVRAAQFAAYKSDMDARKRLMLRLFRHHKIALGNSLTAGNLDAFRLFSERKLQLVSQDGAIGMVVPSAFHANEGTTGLRQLYLQQTRLDYCLSFENRRKLFDIDSRFKFALIVARRPGPTQSLRCAFYLDSFEQTNDPSRLLTYDRAFIQAAGGDYLTLPELRSQEDLSVARHLLLRHTALGSWCETRGIALGRDLHMTDDAAHFVPIGRLLRVGESAADPALAQHLHDRGFLLLHEGKTFHQFTDRWDTLPRYAVPRERLHTKPATRDAARHYRLVFRDVAGSSNERTLIAAIAIPDVVFGHTANTERAPALRPNGSALLLCALLNSFPMDWMVRQKAAAHLSLFIVQGLTVPVLSMTAQRLLAHGALRLSSRHGGYADLWREQLGDAWREPDRAPHCWPAVVDPARRWHLQAAMDAVIAHAFGLPRAAYQHVLGSFTHRTFPAAAALCLAAFDNLAAEGAAAFVRAHDPYWDIAIPEQTRPAVHAA